MRFFAFSRPVLREIPRKTGLFLCFHGFFRLFSFSGFFWTLHVFRQQARGQVHFRISTHRWHFAVSGILPFAGSMAFGSMPAGLRHMDAALRSDPGGDSEQTPEQAGIL